MSGKSRTYRNRKNAGLCVWCGELKDDLGTKVLCSKCKVVQKDKNRKRRSKYLKLNTCEQCGKDVLPNTHSCEKHYFQEIARARMGKTKYWTDLKRIWERQRSKCIYTDEQLILGINASLDHIIPVSIRPDLKESVDNIQWIGRQMNVIKNNMTEEQMKLLFKNVVKRLEKRMKLTPVESMQKQLVEAGSPVFQYREEVTM